MPRPHRGRQRIPLLPQAHRDLRDGRRVADRAPRDDDRRPAVARVRHRQEGERPHKIFESINATGVGLSQSDLLRNYLFMALGERSSSVYDRTGGHWSARRHRGLEGLVRDDLQSAGEFVQP